MCPECCQLDAWCCCSPQHAVYRAWLPRARARVRKEARASPGGPLSRFLSGAFGAAQSPLQPFNCQIHQPNGLALRSPPGSLGEMGRRLGNITRPWTEQTNKQTNKNLSAWVLCFAILIRTAPRPLATSILILSCNMIIVPVKPGACGPMLNFCSWG